MRLPLISLFLGAAACGNVSTLPPPAEPSPVRFIAQSSQGGELQAADDLEAERAMWKACPHGYEVTRKEPIAVGSESTTVDYGRNPLDPILGHAEHTTTANVFENRYQFRCTHAVGG